MVTEFRQLIKYIIIINILIDICLMAVIINVLGHCKRLGEFDSILSLHNHQTMELVKAERDFC